MQPIRFRLDNYEVVISFKQLRKFRPGTVADDENLKLWICRAFNTNPKLLRSKSKAEPRCTARMLYCWALRKFMNYPLTQIGTLINKTHGTVRNAISTIEDRRTVEPGIDRLCNELDLVFGRGAGKVEHQHGMHKLPGCAPSASDH